MSTWRHTEWNKLVRLPLPVHRGTATSAVTVIKDSVGTDEPKASKDVCEHGRFSESLSPWPQGLGCPAARPESAQGSVPAWWRRHPGGQRHAAGAGSAAWQPLRPARLGSETCHSSLGAESGTSCVFPALLMSRHRCSALHKAQCGPALSLPQADAASSSNLSWSHFQPDSCHFHFERFQKMWAWRSGI